jgi:hypothetical protein
MTGRRFAAAALAVAFCTAGIARATDVHQLVQETPYTGGRLSTK